MYEDRYFFSWPTEYDLSSSDEDEDTECPPNKVCPSMYLKGIDGKKGTLTLDELIAEITDGLCSVPLANSWAEYLMAMGSAIRVAAVEAGPELDG